VVQTDLAEKKEKKKEKRKKKKKNLKKKVIIPRGDTKSQLRIRMIN
jgi:hypothetical protein